MPIKSRFEREIPDDFDFPKGGGLLGATARGLALSFHLEEKAKAAKAAKKAAKAAKPPPEDTRSVAEKIRDGAYKVANLEYPSPKDPDKQAKRQAYQAAQAELHEQFKQDLFRENGVVGNPKAELCFQKAWEMGHASGVSEVENYFSDLVELIK